MQICNACRYCEGSCAVFPAMTRRLEFGKADVHYLANLCHNCGACLHACQYAPPHEFAINVPKAMAVVRGQTYSDYAFPQALGALYRHNGHVFREEDELFTETSWIAVMMGQGMMPEKCNPLAESFAGPGVVKEIGFRCDKRKFIQGLGLVAASLPLFLDASPLQIAIARGHACSTIEALLARGADVNYCANSLAPLALAIATHSTLMFAASSRRAETPTVGAVASSGNASSLPAPSGRTSLPLSSSGSTGSQVYACFTSISPRSKS